MTSPHLWRGLEKEKMPIWPETERMTLWSRITGRMRTCLFRLRRMRSRRWRISKTILCL